jgi:hypothetical protein
MDPELVWIIGTEQPAAAFLFALNPTPRNADRMMHASEISTVTSRSKLKMIFAFTMA